MSIERIIELEIKVAYQEDLVQELNKVVAKQQQQIERLEATCKVLNERISAVASGVGAVPPGEEVPPHY
ncbi:MAG: SlyX family protein [Gammaproteobacteria bacterium]